MKPTGLVDLIHWLEDVFEGLGLSRSYGGAIAYNYFGPPRLTQDVDVLVLLPRTRIPALVEALAGAGCVREGEQSEPLELGAVLEDLDGTAHFTALVCFGVRVEIFVPWHPFHHRTLERSPTRDLEGREIPVHAAEDLIVFKKMFDRPKDLQDVKALLLAQRGRLDLGRIRSEARELLPETSLAELEALLDEYA